MSLLCHVCGSDDFSPDEFGRSSCNICGTMSSIIAEEIEIVFDEDSGKPRFAPVISHRIKKEKIYKRKRKIDEPEIIVLPRSKTVEEGFDVFKVELIAFVDNCISSNKLPESIKTTLKIVWMDLVYQLLEVYTINQLFDVFNSKDRRDDDDESNNPIRLDPIYYPILSLVYMSCLIRRIGISSIDLVRWAPIHYHVNISGVELQTAILVQFMHYPDNPIPAMNFPLFYYRHSRRTNSDYRDYRSKGISDLDLSRDVTLRPTTHRKRLTHKHIKPLLVLDEEDDDNHNSHACFWLNRNLIELVEVNDVSKSKKSKRKRFVGNLISSRLEPEISAPDYLNLTLDEEMIYKEGNLNFD